jgi:hypothetical protein
MFLKSTYEFSGHAQNVESSPNSCFGLFLKTGSCILDIGSVELVCLYYEDILSRLSIFVCFRIRDKKRCEVELSGWVAMRD